MHPKNILLISGIVLFLACTSTDPKANDKDVNISADSLKVLTTEGSRAASLPNWAKDLGLTEPQNMHLIPQQSHLTSAFVPGEGFNSVTLVYSGDYDTAMRQARHIAKAAKLPQSKEYKALKKQAMKVGRGNRIKGIAYMNYDLLTRDTNFLIYVKVDDKGLLTISVTDMKQMNLQLLRHAGIEKRKSRHQAPGTRH
jgi:hypothetical protein